MSWKRERPRGARSRQGNHKVIRASLRRPEVGDDVLPYYLLGETSLSKVVALPGSKLHGRTQITCRRPVICQSGVLQEPVPGHPFLLGFCIFRIGEQVEAHLEHILYTKRDTAYRHLYFIFSSGLSQETLYTSYPLLLGLIAQRSLWALVELAEDTGGYLHYKDSHISSSTTLRTQ